VATDDDNATSESVPEIQLVNIVANPPVVANLDATVVQDSVTITGAVSDADDDLDRLLVTVDHRTATAEVAHDSFSVRFDDVAPGSYSAVATACDSLGQTGSETVDFSIEYIPPPSVTATLQKHCEAGRIPWSQYGSYYFKYGLTEFTVYQDPDGTWHDRQPGDTCVTAAVSEHVDHGRAYSKTVGFWFWAETTYFAKGSNDALGESSEMNVSLQESGEGSWGRVDSCQ
jgi:hypothetical protein